MPKIKGSSKEQKQKKKTKVSAKQTTEVTEATAFMASSSASSSACSTQPSKSWFFDTCASGHMTSDEEMMTDIRENEDFVQVANSQRMAVTGIGKVRLQCRHHDGSALPARSEERRVGKECW